MPFFRVSNDCTTSDTILKPSAAEVNAETGTRRVGDGKPFEIAYAAHISSTVVLYLFHLSL
jgi:hypothetical protein